MEAWLSKNLVQLRVERRQKKYFNFFQYEFGVASAPFFCMCCDFNNTLNFFHEIQI